MAEFVPLGVCFKCTEGKMEAAVLPSEPAVGFFGPAIEVVRCTNTDCEVNHVWSNLPEHIFDVVTHTILELMQDRWSLEQELAERIESMEP